MPKKQLRRRSAASQAVPQDAQELQVADNAQAAQAAQDAQQGPSRQHPDPRATPEGQGRQTRGRLHRRPPTPALPSTSAAPVPGASGSGAQNAAVDALTTARPTRQTRRPRSLSLEAQAPPARRARGASQAPTRAPSQAPPQAPQPRGVTCGEPPSNLNIPHQVQIDGIWDEINGLKEGIDTIIATLHSQPLVTTAVQPEPAASSHPGPGGTQEGAAHRKAGEGT